MKIRLLIFIPTLFTISLLAIFFSWHLWKTQLPLISPLDILESYSPFPIPPKTNKVILGFLPYWNMKLAQEINIRHLTHLAYFGTELNPDGTIKKLENPSEQEPGWTKLNSSDFNLLHRQLKLTNKKSILVIRAMTSKLINSILDSNTNQTTAVNSIAELVTTKNFDGINVDFETSGTFSTQTRLNFSNFVKKLSQRCKLINPKCEMSVDILADSAIRPRLYDLDTLHSSVDYVIIMAYDFYRPSSSQSGPIAPLRGKCQENATSSCLEYDVTTSVSDISKHIPPKKILLGIPFYGYQWQTVDTNFLSNVYAKSGSLATYKRVLSLSSDPQISSISSSWLPQTQSSFISFIQNNKTYQIHYEDTRSLLLKSQLVHQANLGGIAIWALGYETPHTDLWQTIADNL